MATYSSSCLEMAEPGGLPSMGSHRIGHDGSDLAAAAGLVLFSQDLDQISKFWPKLSNRFYTFFFPFFPPKYLLIWFWLCWVFDAAWAFSSSSEWNYSLDAVLRLLIAADSLWSMGCRRVDSGVVVHRLVSPRHVGSSQTRGQAPCTLHWQSNP